MLIHVLDPSTFRAHELEFPEALALMLEPPLTLHDAAQWELAPDAVQGKAQIYDLGRHLLGGRSAAVKANGVAVAFLVVRQDGQGWHLSVSGTAGVSDVPLADFEPTASSGLGVSARTLH